MATEAKWDAGLYDAKHSFVWEKASGVVKLLAPKQSERILDLGCGTGALTAEIAAKGSQVVGVDRSAEMIAEARNKFPAIRFEVCDARELPFSGEFDAVFSNAVLHWIPEAERVVQGVARSLRNGGRLVAEFGGRRNVESVVVAMENGLQRLGLSAVGANPWYYPSVGEYSALLEHHGLEVVEAALFERPTKLEDGESGLRNWIAMFGAAFLNRVPPERQGEFFDAVELFARPARWKGAFWELDYRRLRVAAIKAGS
jgi:trans-aconitate methyltransferase